MKELLEEFIEWAKDQGDAFWIYENTDEAIDRFLKEREE